MRTDQEVEVFSRHDEVYTSAIATPEIVGREREIEAINCAIADSSHSYIFYITGVGGIGKTALLRHVLKQTGSQNNLRVAGTLIDLYHTSQRNPERFTKAIQENLAPKEIGFKRYLSEYKKLQRYIVHPPESIDILTAQRQKTHEAFALDFNALSQNKRVVLAVDTAEKLFYEQDSVQEQLNIGQEFASFLRWLVNEFLPGLQDVVVLIAGRPGSRAFFESMQVKGKLFKSLDLGGLTEAASLEYYKAVALRAEKRGSSEDQAVAVAIRSLFTEEYQRVIFWGLCEEVRAVDEEPTIRPLLLALALDYSVSSDNLPEVLTRSLAQVKALSEADRRQNERDMVAEIGYWIRESHRPVVDEILRALAHLRKGAEPELIALVAAQNLKAVEDCLRKNEVRNLAFIKTRKGDNRYFLHDEMYDLLRRPGLARPGETYTIPERIFKVICGYYDQVIQKHRDNVAELYRRASASGLVQSLDLINAKEKLRDALVDDLHYRLRHDLRKGFDFFVRYSDEALISGDENLEFQLHSELLSVLADERRFAETLENAERLQEIERFVAQIVRPDSAVRWVKRYIFLKGNYEKALEIARALRADLADIIAVGDSLVLAELDSMEGYALTMLGRTEDASKLLNEEMIEKLEKSTDRRGNLVRWSAVLARACNNLGYLSRVRWQYIKAEKYYHKAIPFTRSLKLEAWQAAIINNLAYVLALRGQFDTARRQAGDALQMREKIGEVEPIVLSLTTLAEIEIYAGIYPAAQEFAERALKLARRNNYKRGEGLACLSMAALLRFLSEPNRSTPIDERKAYLKRAVEFGNTAYRIFEKETERRISAQTEQGLANRELYRISREEPPVEDDKFTQAVEFVKDALTIAKGRRYWLAYFDAVLSQFWIYYYHPSMKLELSERLDELEKEFAEYYPDARISTAGYPDHESMQAVLPVFGQLARKHVLRGILALDAFEAPEQDGNRVKSENLVFAAQQFTLALEYDSLIARDFRDTVRATNLIYERLKKYNPGELLQIYDAVLDTPGSLLPADRDPKNFLFWRFLEEHLGAYEIMQLSAE